MTLRELAENGMIDALEERWLEAVESPGDVADAIAALTRLVVDGWTDRAAPLALLLAEPLLAAGRHADALAALRPVAGYAAESESLRKHLLAAIRGARTEPWTEKYLEISGLAGKAPVEEALARFEHMCAHEPGRVVLNAAGWGLGLIQDRAPTGRLLVRFPDGAVRPFDPHQLEERLKLLDRDDFRARRLTDLEGLQRQAKEAPGELVRAVATARGGSLSSLELRDELVKSGVIPQSRWSTFWKAAREAVTLDPLIALEGSTTRPQIVLRSRPVTLEEEAEAALRLVPDDVSAARTVDQYIGRGVAGEARDRLLDRLASRILPDAGRRGPEAVAGAVSILLVLERHDRLGDRSPEAILRAACDGDDPGRKLAEVVGAANHGSLRDEIVRLVPRVWPEEALERLTSVYALLPREVHETVCAVAIEQGGAPALAGLMSDMLRLPTRHAEPLLSLTRAWFANQLDGAPGRPSPGDLLQAVIPILALLSRGTGERGKLFKSWHHLVSGRRNSLLDRILHEMTEEEARAALSSVAMHRELPEDVAAWIRGATRERFPHLIEDRELAFWDQPFVFSTQEGINRRKEELRVLVNEKIPENAKAIGRAASYGDLSENAEWHAAIEERGILSQRAEELQREIDLARPIEKAPIPRGIVAPGCRVHLREPDGSERVLIILGPWDQGDERIVSYRSPIAAGLLGTPVGKEVTVELPDGPMTWTVVDVEIAV